jgi:histone acetyltransferase (RNA polymerase elongator complex component)
MLSNNALPYYIIPNFIPQLACPHQCIFCNQQKITGSISIPKPEDVIKKVTAYLQGIPAENSRVEIAFYGGSFTGLPFNLMEDYLKAAFRFVEDGRVQHLRVSTRPDYINQEILDILKKYKVKVVELGAQSFDDEVLRLSGRGHTVEDIEKASQAILDEGIELGLQMMIGLPGDTPEKSVATARRIVALGAANTRIYPVLVIRETPLAKMYSEGKYQPLSLPEAVQRVKLLIPVFEEKNVRILRIGLHPSEGLLTRNQLIAGPFHVSFRELVLTEVWNDLFTPLYIHSGKKEIQVSVSPTELNFAIGYGAANRKRLSQFYRKIRFVADPALTKRDYYVDYH